MTSEPIESNLEPFEFSLETFSIKIKYDQATQSQDKET